MAILRRFRFLHRPARPGSVVTRFSRDGRGTVAVEWAALAIPFFAIIGAIFDIMATEWTIQNLNNALNDAARTIQTGGFQKANAGMTDTAQLLTKFRDKLCNADGTTVKLILVDCAKVKVQVQTFGSMGSGQADTPMNSTTKEWSTDFGTKYTAPGASTITVVQAAVKYPIFLNILKVTPTFADGSRLIQATVVFRTEPF